MSSVEWADDPKRQLVKVVELRRRLGQRREEAIDMVLAPQQVVGSRTGRESVRGTITVESIERGVSAMGTVNFHWEGDCRRCLEIVSGEMDIAIHEIFLVGAPENADLIDFDGELIDLVPIVRDAVALSLPLAPLCSADCAGPDPDRYPALTIEEVLARQERPAGDPRWAALDQLRVEDPSN